MSLAFIQCLIYQYMFFPLSICISKKLHSYYLKNKKPEKIEKHSVFHRFSNLKKKKKKKKKRESL